jgi:hypothetical protein
LLLVGLGAGVFAFEADLPDARFGSSAAAFFFTFAFTVLPWVAPLGGVSSELDTAPAALRAFAFFALPALGDSSRELAPVLFLLGFAVRFGFSSLASARFCCFFFVI